LALAGPFDLAGPERSLSRVCPADQVLDDDLAYREDLAFQIVARQSVTWLYRNRSEPVEFALAARMSDQMARFVSGLGELLGPLDSSDATDVRPLRCFVVRRLYSSCSQDCQNAARDCLESWSVSVGRRVASQDCVELHPSASLVEHEQHP
jgi:hypothetical protein